MPIVEVRKVGEPEPRGPGGVRPTLTLSRVPCPGELVLADNPPRRFRVEQVLQVGIEHRTAPGNDVIPVAVAAIWLKPAEGAAAG